MSSVWTDQRSSVLLTGLLVLHSVFLISPIIYFLGFRSAFVLPGTAVLLLTVAALHDRKLPNWVLLLVVASLVTSCVSGVYWESWKAALFPASFGVSLLAASLANRSELRKLVSISTVILLIMLFGAWVAIALALSGVPPLGHVSGLHERVLYFYFTTLTPTWVGHFIRPAGIYDEPGALSFVICVFAYLRDLMGMDRRITWGMLILGFATFSLAHLIYVTVHFLSERRVLIAWANLVLVLCISVAVLSAAGIWQYFDARLLSRLETSSQSDKVVKGDDRSQATFHALGTITSGGAQVIFVGADVACVEGSRACEEQHGAMGNNPLSPLAYYGLLVSWPYYLFLMISIGIGATRRCRWPLLAVGLLFLQRPFVLSPGYSMLAALVLISVISAPLFRRTPFDLRGRVFALPASTRPDRGELGDR